MTLIPGLVQDGLQHVGIKYQNFNLHWCFRISFKKFYCVCNFKHVEQVCSSRCIYKINIVLIIKQNLSLPSIHLTALLILPFNLYYNSVIIPTLQMRKPSYSERLSNLPRSHSYHRQSRFKPRQPDSSFHSLYSLPPGHIVFMYKGHRGKNRIHTYVLYVKRVYAYSEGRTWTLPQLSTGWGKIIII